MVAKILAFFEFLWSNKERITASRKWLLKRLVKDREVAIFGAGGVGKSTLLKYLAGEYRDVTNVPGEYEESIGIEMTEVSGGKNLVAFAVPGQVSRRATLWRNLKKKLENGKLNGLVIVSCYGYHDLGRLPLREQALFDPESPDDFLEEYLVAKRADEQAIRRELADCCRSRKKKLWILELITKQDLWFDELESVRGEYQPSMKDLVLGGTTNLDDSQIHVETILVSFRIHPFESVDGEVLKSSSPKYTSVLQAESLKRLDRAIDAIMKWN